MNLSCRLLFHIKNTVCLKYLLSFLFFVTMTLRYFNLRLVERKWFWIATYNFVRKANPNNLFLSLITFWNPEKLSNFKVHELSWAINDRTKKILKLWARILKVPSSCSTTAHIYLYTDELSQKTIFSILLPITAWTWRCTDFQLRF